MKKNDLTFSLDKPKAPESAIILYLKLPDKSKYRRSLGKKIPPCQWDSAEQRPLLSRDKSLREITQLIEQIEETIPIVKSDCRRNNRLLTEADLDKVLDPILQTRRNRTAHKGNTPGADMFTDFTTLIEGMKDGSVLTPGKRKKKYSPETVKNYEKSVRVLKDFYKGSYAGVTLQLYNSFLTWCHSKEYSDNSIGTFIKCWKRLLNLGYAKGWHTNAIGENEDFMILKEDTPDIYLDEAKIEKIYRVKVPVRHYDLARDWFVLDCYLGLRVGDLQQISMADFAGDVFQFVNNKTGATVAIPIHPFVKQIIKKYKGLPPSIPDQRLNDYIKIVAKLAGLKKKFLYKVTKGGVVQTTAYQEWQMVSSHTCRRSFITNLLKMGEPHAQIMKLAGITRYETLMKYFKQSPEEVATEAAEYKFFKGK